MNWKYMYTDGVSGQLLNCTQKAWFAVRQDTPGTNQVFTMYIVLYTIHIPCKGHLLELRLHFQKARNKRTSAKEVLNPFYIESGNLNRWGLVYSLNSLLFHASSSPQTKFLNGAEENQVKQNILIAMVVGAHPSTYGMQHTVEEQLETHKPHTV